MNTLQWQYGFVDGGARALASGRLYLVHHVPGHGWSSLGLKARKVLFSYPVKSLAKGQQYAQWQENLRQTLRSL